MIVSSISRVVPWVSRKLRGATFNANEAIGLERHGEMVAGVIYENWNGASFVVHIAVDGLMTPSYLAAIYHYPFVQVGASKLIAPVSPGNHKSIRLVKKMGFEREATLSGAHPDGDLLLYTMSLEKCRYIGERYGKKCRIASASA